MLAEDQVYTETNKEPEEPVCGKSIVQRIHCTETNQLPDEHSEERLSIAYTDKLVYIQIDVFSQDGKSQEREKRDGSSLHKKHQRPDK